VDPAGLNRTTTQVYSPDDDVVVNTVSDAVATISTTSKMYDPMGRLIAQTSYPKTVLTPVGRWRLNETSGTQASDSSGHGPVIHRVGLGEPGRRLLEQGGRLTGRRTGPRIRARLRQGAVQQVAHDGVRPQPGRYGLHHGGAFMPLVRGKWHAPPGGLCCLDAPHAG
jgi:hypothetical protein